MLISYIISAYTQTLGNKMLVQEICRSSTITHNYLTLAAYKSSVMKTIISTAREHITEDPEQYNKIASDSIERYL